MREEPDALIAHVRICGSPGKATTQGHPAILIASLAGLIAAQFPFRDFTHYWSKSRKGNWAVFRKTMATRLSRGLNAIAEWCRKNRHQPVREQYRSLSRKLRGHCAYYGITGNSAALQKFRRGMRNLWMKWLRRRSRAARAKSWVWWEHFFERYDLPPAKAIHSSLRVT